MERVKGHDWKVPPDQPVPFEQQTPSDIDTLFQRMALFTIVYTQSPISPVFQWAEFELRMNGAFQSIVEEIE